MSNIPPKPKREDFREFFKLEGLFTHSFVNEERFIEAERDYYKAIAERAIEALRKAAKQLARTVNDDFDKVDAVIQGMEKALADIIATDTGERG